MNICERLKRRRKELGYTLQYVADKTNIARQTVHKYENGIISNIPSDKIECLAKVLKTTPAYLMGWEDNQTEQSIDKILIEALTELSEEETIKVMAFIEGLKANR